MAASLQKVLEKRPELLDAFALMCEPERQASICAAQRGRGGGDINAAYIWLHGDLRGGPLLLVNV